MSLAAPRDRLCRDICDEKRGYDDWFSFDGEFSHKMGLIPYNGVFSNLGRYFARVSWPEV
jgi:hypothetical protein